MKSNGWWLMADEPFATYGNLQLIWFVGYVVLSLFSECIVLSKVEFGFRTLKTWYDMTYIISTHSYSYSHSHFQVPLSFFFLFYSTVLFSIVTVTSFDVLNSFEKMYTCVYISKYKFQCLYIIVFQKMYLHNYEILYSFWLFKGGNLN